MDTYKAPTCALGGHFHVRHVSDTDMSSTRLDMCLQPCLFYLFLFLSFGHGTAPARFLAWRLHAALSSCGPHVRDICFVEMDCQYEILRFFEDS